MRADSLRQKFLDFFKSKKHRIVQSDSLVPKDDPTVLFTPAGMNQFKKQFLGAITDFTMAATSQRCLRTDDLDKVGITTGHHTLFEMLGNFSFGDYFKKEAIGYAWEFLTEALKIEKSKLWISVYKDDDEAYKIWKDKIPGERILKLGDKENFWPSEAKEKGPNGPCGPCSEIFFDFGKRDCPNPECNPSCECGRFVEIWNLVFTQFNRKEGGTLEPLPQKNIDTGMGLERLTAVIQGAPNNFETDLFKPLIKEVVSNINHSRSDEKQLIYAVCDHIRAVTFAIYDGISPSNEGRGYVVRKIIRKSMLHLRALGIEKPFLYKLVPVVSQIMKQPYPELDGRRENIAEIILSEEKNFISVLKTSDSLIANALDIISAGPHLTVKSNFSGEIVRLSDYSDSLGKAAFQLYDTYGIPLELTIEWLNKNKREFSADSFYKAFDKELEEQKFRSKTQSKMKGDVFKIEEFKLDVGPTKFLGYKTYQNEAKILKLIKDEKEIKKISAGDEAGIILDKTCFYPESGGQVGDSGFLIRGKNLFEVTDTQKKGKIIIHTGRVKAGNFKKTDSLTVKVDIQRRLSTARNHTATHLLQAALRNILGAHVKQQGSLVSDEKLRFDFTHFKDISDDEIERIEERINDYILGNYSLSVKEMSLATAKKTGALAFFAEKYEGRMRVVTIGDFSKEFCGGTHLEETGSIGIFKLIHEGAVASGIRRIEAVTGKQAYKIIKEDERIIRDISLCLNLPKKKLLTEIEKKNTYIKELEKQLNTQKLDAVKSSVDEFIKGAELVNNINFITRVFENQDMAMLRKQIDFIKQKTQNSVICLASNTDGKALLVMGVTADLAIDLDASKLIREVSGLIGGSGGGRKDFAQAGGNNPGKFPEVFAELRKKIAQ